MCCVICGGGCMVVPLLVFRRLRLGLRAHSLLHKLLLLLLRRLSASCCNDRELLPVAAAYTF